MKKWIILVVALLVAAALVWFFFFRSGGATVATVDGINITEDDVSFRMRDAENALWQEYNDMFPDHMDFDYDVEFRDGLTFGEAVRQEAVRMAATEALILREARRLNTNSLSREEIEHVNEHISSTREHFDAAEPGGFNAALLGAGFRGEAQWRNILDNQRIMQNTIEAIMENPDELARLAPYMNGGDDDESPTSRADAIYARIQAGEDFDTLMHLYSEDPGLANYPDGYTFGPMEMVPEFEEGTRELAIGEVSRPVRTSHGYHIIMRIAPFEDGMLRPLGEDESLSDLYAAKHILISAGAPGNDQMQAIFEAFEAMARQADIVFLPALNNIRVAPQED